MTHKQNIVGGLAAIALALAGTAASAAVQVDTASYDAASAAQLLELSLFDGTLGTLNSATLTFSGSLSATASVANTSAALNLTNVTVGLFGELSATAAPGGPAALDATVSLVAPLTNLGTRTFVILGPGAQTSTGPITLTPAPLVQTFTGADAQGFVGTGSFGYSFASSAIAGVPARFTTVVVNATSQSSGSLSISYDYTPTTPVPEPGGWALMLAGLGVGGFVLRYKGQQPLAARAHNA